MATSNIHPRSLKIEDFIYDLPEQRIAAYPLEQRDASKLLVYREGEIVEDKYLNLADHIEPGHLLVFNNTKVVEARLFFSKPSGGKIEVFCLEPHERYQDITSAMLQTGGVLWKCLVGGASKWKQDMVLTRETTVNGQPLILNAAMQERRSDTFVLELSWAPAHYSFAEVLHHFGVIPIPPYLKRDTESSDQERYQTIYAKWEGSVAAPTAGLHFTPAVFDKLAARQIEHCFVTLHVGAGTFKPVKSETMEGHEMHAEFMDVSKTTIEQLIQYAGKVIAIGTTSLRTLESLYWMGIKAGLNPDASIDELEIGQWDVYDHLSDHATSIQIALSQLLRWMEKNKTDRIIAKTQIMIAPGYELRMIEALVTNFHQPQSTLLLLVSAAIGDDWRQVYNYALEHDFRFLSYGDGSLLWKRSVNR
ncbi:S-adenosylmethionine:tRNA ribosyltransferase-isomerase [Flavihumibacter rivuli]|uniref:S-adenosylmethionine:tRNA ribosyltransferase-isomerase n=1 Tax=Flavihumibacter rivuli TaxID=2838156 RepID=UPI001EFBCCFA|nr:S-adenosylmethionine:tRNA ribosyltransferase-isomerase [Flavihumibacter rivuli]ULQ56529.1 S-adenosylmethionine:tRNA ribosyltransferase-isomerase [Flavihumibacter rivuli]